MFLFQIRLLDHPLSYALFRYSVFENLIFYFSSFSLRDKQPGRNYRMQFFPAVHIQFGNEFNFSRENGINPFAHFLMNERQTVL